MRLQFKYIFLAILILSITPVSGFSKDIKWEEYKSAVKLSKDSGKKLYLYFYSNRCHWCNVMNKKTLADKEIAAYLNKNFIPVRINVADNYPLVRQFKIGPIPATIFMEPGASKQIYLNKKNAREILGYGVEVGTIPGYLDKETFSSLLKTVKLEEYK